MNPLEEYIPVWENEGEHNPDPGQYYNFEGTLVSERQVLQSAA